jgi:uncharacterized membrane protein YeiH
MTLIGLLDYAAVFVFALTGALVASRAQLDIIGFIFIAALTAVGGGTLRDIMLNRDQLFWITDPTHIAVAGGAAIVVFFTAHFFESRLRAIAWLDAVALAVAVPAGVGVALNLEQSWGIVLIMGVSTGCFGGLMRDVVCNEVPLVLKQGELYVTAALSGAAIGQITNALTANTPLSLVFCAATTLALRAGSMAFGWSLPVFKSRPPRP